MEGDIHDTQAVKERPRDHKLDAVMHFAAWLSVGESVGNPAGYYRNNVVGALSVLQAMVDAGVHHFVFSSTAAVFGNPEQTPITELHPTRPINAYGETKLAIERALPHYDHAYGLRSVALRYFNAAGADPDGELGEDHAPEIHVIPRAIDAALGRGRFQIFGDDYATPDGTCLRDYVHVTDLAAAHVLALDALQVRRAVRRSTTSATGGRRRSVTSSMRSRRSPDGRCQWEAAPRREAIPASCLRRAIGSGATSAGSRRFEDLRRDRRDRLAVAHVAPERLRARSWRLMSRLKGQLTDPLLSVVMPVYNERDDDRGDHPPRPRGPDPHRADRRRRRVEGRDARDPDAAGGRAAVQADLCSRRTPARAPRSGAGSRR